MANVASCYTPGSFTVPNGFMPLLRPAFMVSLLYDFMLWLWLLCPFILWLLSFHCVGDEISNLAPLLWFHCVLIIVWLLWFHCVGGFIIMAVSVSFLWFYCGAIMVLLCGWFHCYGSYGFTVAFEPWLWPMGWDDKGNLCAFICGCPYMLNLTCFLICVIFQANPKLREFRLNSSSLRRTLFIGNNTAGENTRVPVGDEPIPDGPV